ncbi:hypothetical protein [Rhizobium sp. BK251]|uniref:hypothetical protein n=1 Tax=Rhizobium sp. BK251 TaxID=2512125 RepID=UPI001049632F|nr:hypothetical protein [Rhizobium sp. BK251]TCL73787.1 hypothetical protein EV286_103320 [Rhizobium sp. BK251]
MLLPQSASACFRRLLVVLLTLLGWHDIASATELPCIYALGDSLTAAYAPELAAIVGAGRVVDGGLGGQASPSIAARAGARPIRVTLAGNAIPASGTVAVDRIAPELLAFAGNRATLSGAIAGISGTMIWQRGEGYSFQRSKPGAAMAAGPSSAFVVDASDVEDCTLLLWAGRNNYRDTAGIIGDIFRTMDLWKKRGQPAYIISIIDGVDEGRGTAAYQAITRLNGEIEKRYPDQYVDVRRWLIDEAPRAMSLTLSPQGIKDTAVDTVPTDLRKDGIHLTPATNRALAQFLAEKLKLGQVQ